MLPPPNIPDHWSAEQALAVYDWLNSLCELVWERYRVKWTPKTGQQFKLASEPKGA
jgi:hypothetical protein